MRFIGVLIKSIVCLLAIIGMVALYLSNPFGHSDKAMVSAVRSDLMQIQSALKLYHKDNGSLPTEEQGLKAVVRKGYLKKLLSDPWGQNYHYKLIIGSKHNEAFIWSFEENNEAGTMKSIIVSVPNQSVQLTQKDAPAD